MRTSSTLAEIMHAVQDLNLPEDMFRILDERTAAPILDEIENRFVAKQGLRWWWEAFRVTPVVHRHFTDGTGWRHLTGIVPSDEDAVWFVAEGDHGFILCCGCVKAIQSVIGQCSPFEYYLVSPKLDWLICENHHDVVYAVGDAVAEQLRRN